MDLFCSMWRQIYIRRTYTSAWRLCSMHCARLNGAVRVWGNKLRSPDVRKDCNAVHVYICVVLCSAFLVCPKLFFFLCCCRCCFLCTIFILSWVTIDIILMAETKNDLGFLFFFVLFSLLIVKNEQYKCIALIHRTIHTDCQWRWDGAVPRNFRPKTMLFVWCANGRYTEAFRHNYSLFNLFSYFLNTICTERTSAHLCCGSFRPRFMRTTI